MIPVWAICYFRVVHCYQLPSVKAEGDCSGLCTPQIILHSLGFWGPNALQDTDNHPEKGGERKGHKESNRRCLISPGHLISDFSATSQDGLLNL